MGRTRRGFALARQSWSVVRADRSLLWFPVIAGIASILAGGVFFGLGGGLGASADSVWVAVPFLVVGLYLVIAIGQFCAVALTACATASLDGRDTTVGEGIAAARARLGVILSWAGVALVVGALIAAVQALLREAGGNLVGSLFGGIANLAWTVATFFVVPLIALEGLGPREAIRRSGSIVRQRWGEGVVGTATIGGAVFLVGMLPGMVLIVLGAALTDSAAAPGAVVMALGAGVIVVAVVVQNALGAVFRVALYRYAVAGDAAGPFAPDQLQDAFRPKRGSRLGP
jgi:hypothetical protein